MFPSLLQSRCVPNDLPGSSESIQGEYQRKLYKDLLGNYSRLERPVVNDSMAIQVELGLTLLQIIDVVSKLGVGGVCVCVCMCVCVYWLIMCV